MIASLQPSCHNRLKSLNSFSVSLLDNAQHGDFRIAAPVLSEPDADWQGATGLVHHAVLKDQGDLSGWQVYACGNPLMIRNARRDFERSGSLPPDQFFADPFVPSGTVPADGVA
jgi:NAD(P)H-flavin reductase